MDIGNGQILGNRASQQDYFATVSHAEYVVLILADGIGGMKAGDEASYIAVQSCKQFLLRSTISDISQTLSQCAEFANRAVGKAADQLAERDSMGTTLIICVISDSTFSWLSIGDSLIYRMKNGALSRLNSLHTRMMQLQTQVLDGSITQSEADAKPDKESITSALTGAPISEMDIQSIDRSPEDLFIVSSDGIDTIRHGAIRGHLLNYTSAQSTCDALIDSVVAAKNPYQDNCTVLVAGPQLEQVETKKKLRKMAIWVWGLLGLVAVMLTLIAIYFLLTKPEQPDTPSPEIPLSEEPVSKPAPGFVPRNGGSKDGEGQAYEQQSDEVEDDSTGASGALEVETPAEKSKEVERPQQSKPTVVEENPKSSGSFFTNQADEADSQQGPRK